MSFLLSIAIFLIIIVILAVIYQKHWNRAVKCTSQNRLDGKIILITGANSGLGKAVATELAKRGGHIVIACRKLERAEKAAVEIRSLSGNSDVDVLQVDVSSQDSIKEFVHQYSEKYEHLDILIHNAGVMGGPYKETDDGLELTMATNHLGPFLLTHLLLDSLQASLPARIITMSSHAHIFAALNADNPLQNSSLNSATQIYCDAALANILFTAELGYRLQDSGISAFAVHPGLVYTNLYKQCSLVQWFPLISQWIGKWMMKSEEEGIQTVLHCALADDVEQYTGRYFSNCTLSTPNVSGLNRNLGRQLWASSCRLVNISQNFIPADNDVHELSDHHDHEEAEVDDSDYSDDHIDSVVDQLQFVGLDEIHKM